jgi:hypothetical protein
MPLLPFSTTAAEDDMVCPPFLTTVVEDVVEDVIEDDMVSSPFVG